MKIHTTGKRHPLLIYRRRTDPAWQTALGLGLIVVVGQQLSGQVLPYVGLLPFLPSPFDEMLLVSGLGLVVVGLFLLLGSRLAYTQARPDHLRVATPFTRIKISYRRVRSIHPANIAQLFPPENLRGSARSFLEPFLGRTAVAIELNSLPLSQGSMRFFLGTHSLFPRGTGLILLVPDWMSLSTELDSIYGNWRQGQSRAPGTPGRGRSGYPRR
jgi:hypothetical protein